ncbi:MAG: hypothetical protein HRU41_22800, partial [Saprospiraceae bacterium]|nr:hypothetical protein [Saprospiraceae bacterium]
SLKRHSRIGALEQLRQYPADERWLAIGIDSISKESQFHRLLQHCRKAGIGLLVVPEAGSPVVHTHPRFSTRSDVTDYSQYYKNAPLALKRIGKTKKQKGYGMPTRAQFKFRLQLHSMVGVGLLFCLLFVIPPLQQQNQVDTQESVRSYSTHSTSYSNGPIPPTDQHVGIQLPEETTRFTCNYLSFLGRRLLLVDQFYFTEAAAIDRVALLQAAGFTKADYFWLPCYDNSRNEAVYCVHPYDPRVDESRIADQEGRYEYLTHLHEINIGIPMIIWIEKP